MFFARYQLSTQLVILVTSAIVLAVAVCTALAIVQTNAAVHQEIDQRSAALAALTGDLIVVPAANRDTAGVSRILQMMVREDALESATLFDTTGAIVVEQHDTEAAPEQDDSDAAEDRELALQALQAGQPQEHIAPDHVDYAIPLLQDGQSQGVLVARATSEGAADELTDTILFMLGGGLAVALLVALFAAWFARSVARPLRNLAVTATAIGQGELIDPPAIAHGSEIGALARAFRQMVSNLRTQQAAVEQRTHDLQLSLDAQQQLVATVQQLSVPLLPVLQGVVVLPVVGHVDQRRAQAIMETLLHGVAKQGATVTILDITGIASVDTHVVELLLQATQAIELLGATPMLAGISAEMAQHLVAQGTNLGRVRTYRDLRAAIEAAWGASNGQRLPYYHAN
jgi:anti-anti-sigma regulatory factor/HAMP domain-containing protein